MKFFRALIATLVLVFFPAFASTFNDVKNLKNTELEKLRQASLQAGAEINSLDEEFNILSYSVQAKSYKEGEGSDSAHSKVKELLTEFVNDDQGSFIATMARSKYKSRISYMGFSNLFEPAISAVKYVSDPADGSDATVEKLKAQQSALYYSLKNTLVKAKSGLVVFYGDVDIDTVHGAHVTIVDTVNKEILMIALSGQVD